MDEIKDRYQKITMKLHRLHNDYVLLVCEGKDYEKQLRNIILPTLLDYHQTVLQETVDRWLVVKILYFQIICFLSVVMIKN